jgi:hypothetical protein
LASSGVTLPGELYCLLTTLVEIKEVVAVESKLYEVLFLYLEGAFVLEDRSSNTRFVDLMALIIDLFLSKFKENKKSMLVIFFFYNFSDLVCVFVIARSLY